MPSRAVHTDLVGMLDRACPSLEGFWKVAQPLVAPSRVYLCIEAHGVAVVRRSGGKLGHLCRISFLSSSEWPEYGKQFT